MELPLSFPAEKPFSACAHAACSPAEQPQILPRTLLWAAKTRFRTQHQKRGELQVQEGQWGLCLRILNQGTDRQVKMGKREKIRWASALVRAEFCVRLFFHVMFLLDLKRSSTVSQAVFQDCWVLSLVDYNEKEIAIKLSAVKSFTRPKLHWLHRGTWRRVWSFNTNPHNPSNIFFLAFFLFQLAEVMFT